MQHRDSIPEIGVSQWIGPTPAPIAGVASVIDGDTIEIHGQRIRFNGIDAPESRRYCDDAKGFEYPCGRRAAEALDNFLATSKPVQCAFVSWDRYEALDWPRYSQGAYAGQQAKAEAAKVGLFWLKTDRPATPAVRDPLRSR